MVTVNAETRAPRRWPGLPAPSEIGALAWPHVGARSALTNAHELLQWSQLNDEEVQRITECVINAEDAADDKGPMESVLLESADKIARQVNAPDGALNTRLTAEGWLVPEMPRATYRVQIEHVFAVGALLCGARLVRQQRKAARLLRDLLKPDLTVPVPDVREALYSTELVIGCCRLSAEAMFIMGRVDMQQFTRQQEAQARSERAARGGQARREFSDDDLTAFYVAWQARHGRRRGARKAAALQFGVTEAAIGKRLKRIRTD